MADKSGPDRGDADPGRVDSGPEGHGVWERAVLLALSAMAIAAVVVFVFVIPEARTNSQAVLLLSALAWPYIALAAIVAFHAQFAGFLAIIATRVKSGSSFSIAKVFDLGAATERVPAPNPGSPVTLANVALLHSTWFSEKATLKMNDGLRYYRVDVVIVAKAATLQRIDSVTYHLPDSWPAPLRERTHQRCRKALLVERAAQRHRDRDGGDPLQGR